MPTKKNNFEYDAADIPARLDTGDVPSRSQASLESFTSVTDTNRVLIHELRELLREAEAESPAATAAALTKALTPEQRAQFFNAMLVKEVDEAGLFPQVKANYNELADTFSMGGYPYKHRYPLRLYEKELYDLQVELLKLQEWVKSNNQKIVVIFEGRDAAGKGGTIRRFNENLNPRGARIVALSKPTVEETQQWYFQRYVAQLPKPGEICFFDRSWYNRAVVEPVMGFCTQEQTEMFLSEVADFERSLQRAGIRLFKFWLAISQEEQLKRFRERRDNPLKPWKISPVDIASVDKWDDYTKAINHMFDKTDMNDTPWMVVRNEDKRRGRLNAIRAFLRSIEYDGRDLKRIGIVDPLIVGRAGILFHREDAVTQADIHQTVQSVYNAFLTSQAVKQSRKKNKDKDKDKNGKDSKDKDDKSKEKAAKPKDKDVKDAKSKDLKAKDVNNAKDGKEKGS